MIEYKCKKKGKTTEYRGFGNGYNLYLLNAKESRNAPKQCEPPRCETALNILIDNNGPASVCTAYEAGRVEIVVSTTRPLYLTTRSYDNG